MLKTQLVKLQPLIGRCFMLGCFCQPLQPCSTHLSVSCVWACVCARVCARCKVWKCKLPEFLQVIEDGNVGENAGYWEAAIL